MKAAIFALALITANFHPAHSAEDLTRLALTLGDIMGSETTCGLKLDPEAIRSFISKKVPPGDMKFMSTVEMSARVSPRDFERMTRSMQVAHCFQIERIAKDLALLIP